MTCAPPLQERPRPYDRISFLSANPCPSNKTHGYPNKAKALRASLRFA